MMHRKTAQALAVAALASLPMLAAAQFTGNVALTSNYKFRGQDQDTSKNRAFKPAIQGGLDYAFGETGWYVGNWNSSVNWLPGNSIESDFYGGYKFAAGGIAWDVGALTYVYPGNSTGNTTELYGAGTLGPVTLKYAATVSKDYFGYANYRNDSGLKGTGTGYLSLIVAQEIAPSLTLKGAVNYTRFSSDIRGSGVPSYVDYAVGVSYDFGNGLALYGGVQGATKKNYFGDINKARAIVTVSKAL
jgi:uncharacterized protein (TIGR02001 family)